MEISVVVKNGIRAGKIREVKQGLVIEGTVPSQAMVHPTNFNHMNTAKNHSIDFGTPFLEVYSRIDPSIFEMEPEDCEANRITNAKKRMRIAAETARLKGVVEKNPDKICLMVLAGSKTKQITKETNLHLLKMQIDAGFTYPKVYMKGNRNAEKQLEEYLRKVPEGRHLVPILDEKLNTETFEALYLAALSKTPIIGFMGRSPTDSDENVKLNYIFIRDRKTDSVIRLVSEISRGTKSGLSKSLLYSHLGYDVFSFLSKSSRYHIIQPLRIISGFRYQKLADNPQTMCPINKGRTLAQTVEVFRPGNAETVPCSIYNHIQLNREFSTLADDFTHERIRDMLGEELKALTETS